MNFYRYFLAGLKRIRRLFPEIMGLSLLFFVLVIIMGRMLIANSDYETGKSRYGIGLLVEGDNQLVDLGIYLLESFDDSKYLVEIKKYSSREEGVEALYKNEVSALCEIPDEFYDSINELSNDVSIKYYTASGARGITGVYMDAVTGMVSNYVLYSEAGIFSLMDFCDYKGHSAQMMYEDTDRLFLAYMNAIIGRGELVEVKPLGISNGLSTYAYFFVGLSLFMVCVFSFAAISYFLEKSNSLDCIANSRGINAPMQVVADFIAYYLCNALCTLILFVPIWLVLRMGAFSIPEFEDLGLLDFAKYISAVYTAMILLCVFEFIVFEALEGTINKIIFSLVIIIGSGYVSGLLYPKTFFPESLQKFGELLPTGVSLSFLSAAVSGDDYEKWLYILLAYAVCLFGVLCFVRQRKIRR